MPQRSLQDGLVVGDDQVEAMKKNKPLLVVGTPGRLAELSRAGALQTHSTGILVLDEVCSRGSLVRCMTCCSNEPVHGSCPET